MPKQCNVRKMFSTHGVAKLDIPYPGRWTLSMIHTQKLTQNGSIELNVRAKAIKLFKKSKV